MVAQVRSKWENLPDTAQRWAKIGGLLAGAVLFLGTGARLDTVMGDNLTPRVVSIEAQLDTFRAEGNRTSRGVEYIICRDQRRELGLPLDYCDYLWSAVDFLPPAQ